MRYEHLYQIRILYIHAEQTISYFDGGRATNAYNLLKLALETYREYGNDKKSAVTLQGEGTSETTVRLNDIHSIVFSDLLADRQIDMDLSTVIGELNRDRKRAYDPSPEPTQETES